MAPVTTNLAGRAIGAALLLMAAMLALPRWIGVDSGEPATGRGIVVVATVPVAGSVAAAPAAAPTSATTDRAAPPPAAMLAAAPAALRTLHASVAAAGADSGAAAALREAFAQVAGLSGVTASCTAARCEVHGLAAADETGARLILRNGAFLDRLGTFGMTAGMDMVSQQGDASTFILYLDRGTPVP